MLQRSRLMKLEILMRGIDPPSSWELGTSKNHQKSMSKSEVQGIIWASSGHHLGIIWASSGHHLGITWASSGHHLGIIWAFFWASSGHIFKMFFEYFFEDQGGHLGGGGPSWRSPWSRRILAARSGDSATPASVRVTLNPKHELEHATVSAR